MPESPERFRRPERFEPLPEDEELDLCTLATCLSDRLEALSDLRPPRVDHGVQFLLDRPDGLSLGRFAEGGLILEDASGESVRGLGDGRLVFTSAAEALAPALIVGLHTDAPTRAQARALARSAGAMKLPPPRFETTYHFNDDGAIAKYATFPEALRDARPDLTPPHLKADFLAGLKVVRSRVGRDEYRLIGFTLTALGKKLDAALERRGHAS